MKVFAEVTENACIIEISHSHDSLSEYIGWGWVVVSSLDRWRHCVT